jgi:hypothetical protein
MADNPERGDFSPMTLRLASLCENKCTVCKKARQQESGLWRSLVKLEGRFCPMCRAYEKVYGVPAYQKRPNP